MQQIVLDGSPPLVVHLRRSARARRLTLRIAGTDGRITLSLPSSTSDDLARAFAREKEPWLRQHLSRQPGAVTVGHNATIPVEGRMMRIVPATGRTIQIQAGQLQVPGQPDQAAARIQGWLKTRARDRLTAESDAFARRLGRPYSRITLRDTRSRWGSCSSQGALMYSWRLIMAPPEVLSYVAAHEVAHLAQMNHSPAFWATLAQIHGPYEPARDWLRSNGSLLHRYIFTD